MNEAQDGSWSAADLLLGARFLAGAVSYLRRPLAVDQARSIVRHRVRNRGVAFLDLVKRGVYEHAPSPYLPLLRAAGCEYGDLDRLVGTDGLEGALLALFRSGVYLTVDEMKGRQAVVRGSLRFVLDPLALRNPLAAFHLPSQTSGSRGAPSIVPRNFSYLRDRATTALCSLSARGIHRARHAVWMVPGGGIVNSGLELRLAGAGPLQLFTQVATDAPRLHPRYRWSVRAIRWASRLTAAPIRGPVYASPDDPEPVLAWARSVLRAGQTPHVYTFSSSAVRFCQAALAANVPVRGTQFTTVGEPLTRSRRSTIERAGPVVQVRYSTADSGLLAYGCLTPNADDDMHVCLDSHALIQPGQRAAKPGLPSRALLASSLLRACPLVLLNVSLGDHGIVERRTCGCPLDALGWSDHLYALGSFEKLTAGGMTFDDRTVVRVLEDLLPERFGGGPTDYQLLEEEDGDGRPCLRLLADPKIGPIDEHRLIDVFLEGIGGGSGPERYMALQWRGGQYLCVERRPPLVGASGKILHILAQRHDSAARHDACPVEGAAKPG